MMTGSADGEWVVRISFERVETIHPGHHDVEQDRVELLLGNLRQRGRTIIRFDDLEAAPAE